MVAYNDLRILTYGIEIAKIDHAITFDMPTYKIVIRSSLRCDSQIRVFHPYVSKDVLGIWEKPCGFCERSKAAS